MTISNTQVRVSYTGDSSTTQFPIPFPFYLDTDITVTVGNAAQSSGYSITGGEDANGNPQTGTVIFSSAPATGVAVQFILDVPLTQLVNLVDGTAFPSKTLNQVNDRAVQALLRVQDQLDRTVTAPDGDVLPNLALPAASTRANTYLTFDSSGNLSVAQSVPSGTLSQSSIGQFLYPRTAAETTAGVTPTNFSYPSHLAVGGCLLERYGGGIGESAAANSTAFASALLVSGQVDCPIFITAGLGTWQFNQPWVMTGTGQALSGVGPPPGGAGVTGCRVHGIKGRPTISFTSISTSADCITLGGSNLPQVELRDLIIQCNGSVGSPNGRDGVVILGSSHPIVENVVVMNSQRDAFVLSPNGTLGQWIERGEFSVTFDFCGRHGLNFNLLGSPGANPFINECLFKIVEVRGVSFVTAGGNAIAHNASAGLGGAAKSADNVFLHTVFDCRYVVSSPPAGYTSLVPDTSPVKCYAGVMQNWVFVAPAWENTGAVLVGGAGTFYNVSTNSGAGTIGGLTMVGALTNSFWSNAPPDPLIATLFNFDVSYRKTNLVGPATLIGSVDNTTVLTLSGQTTASQQGDISITRTGTPTVTPQIGQGAGFSLGNTTSSTFASIQEWNGNLSCLTFFNGIWGERCRIRGDGAVQIGGLSSIYTCSGGPPSAGTGSNGDFAFRQDGGAGTSIYMKRSGTWVGIV